MKYQEQPIDIECMLIRDIYCRARKAGRTYSMWQHGVVVAEAQRLVAKIRRTQRFDDTNVDDCVRVIRTVQGEPLPRPEKSIDDWRIERAREYYRS